MGFIIFRALGLWLFGHLYAHLVFEDDNLCLGKHFRGAIMAFVVSAAFGPPA